MLKKYLSVANSGAIAAAYGSVSAVTFVTAISYLEFLDISMSGHMVAIMALMESPAIISGLLLISIYGKKEEGQIKKKDAILHSFTNGSVLMILGSLVIGFLANEAQAEGIKPFTTDLFKGFLAIFLLDMGIASGKKLHAFISKGIVPVGFSLVFPLLMGVIVAIMSAWVTDDVGNRFIFAVLGASASYIAVPAAMRIAVPKANEGLYLPMALAVTFPVNITIGMPLYYWVINSF